MEISGEVDWWVGFDGRRFKVKKLYVLQVSQKSSHSVVPDRLTRGYQFNLKVTDYNDPGHVSSLTYNLYVRQVYDIRVDTY